MDGVEYLGSVEAFATGVDSTEDVAQGLLIVYAPADDAWMVFNATPGGEVKRAWWKAALDHHARKGKLLILLMRIRDRLRRMFG